MLRIYTFQTDVSILCYPVFAARLSSDCFHFIFSHSFSGFDADTLFIWCIFYDYVEFKIQYLSFFKFIITYTAFKNVTINNILFKKGVFTK